jgi:enamine deaminase RidA (YjgF/YER057c/UK114 family)
MLHAGLAQAGMGMNNLARTWFFLDRILSWYGDFNGVRNDFFSRTELRAAGVPASTGVGGRNPAAASLASAAWAVRASDPASHPLVIVPSPLQCPAPAYGSAFSRALEIQSPGFRQLLVSGTASIEPGGRTAHPGDVQAQIGLTMEVVDAILASRGMSFSDVTRATAYYRSASDAPRFAGWLDRHDLRRMPVVHACCDICRDDLLFEIELDAIRPA